jgi:hypothetical protein
VASKKVAYHDSVGMNVHQHFANSQLPTLFEPDLDDRFATDWEKTLGHVVG